MVLLAFLSVTALFLVVVVVLALTRSARDEMSTTVRSFDDFREALSPGVAALDREAKALGQRLDRPRHG